MPGVASKENLGSADAGPNIDSNSTAALRKPFSVRNRDMRSGDADLTRNFMMET